MFKKGRESTGKKRDGRENYGVWGWRKSERGLEREGRERKKMSGGHINFLLFPQHFQIIKALME